MDTGETDESDVPLTRRKLLGVRIIAEVFLLAFVYTLGYTSFNGLQALQSTLNGGLGFTLLGIVYAFSIISGFIAPAIVEKLTPKGAILAGLLVHGTWQGVHFYPVEFTLIPAAIFLGLGFGPLWTAQGMYVTSSGLEYADKTGREVDGSISLLNGIFWACYKTTVIWGNIVSWRVLQNAQHILGNNTTLSNSSGFLSVCGIHNCPYSNDGSDTQVSDYSTIQPSKQQMYILLGIYSGLVLLGFVVAAVFLKPLSQQKTHTSENKLDGVKDALLMTVRTLRNPKLLLLLPLFVLNGLIQSFTYGDYTKAFVACELGIEWVGYTMMCYGVTSAISPWVFGHLHKWIGFPINYTAAGIINMALFIQMLVYPVSKEHLGYFFFIPGIWGVLNGMWQSRTLALLGIHFSHNQRPAFANYHLWQGVGFTVSFAYGNLLCVATKIYICMTMLVLSLLLYYVVEIKTRLEKKKEKSGQVISDEKQNGNIPEAEKLSPNGIREDDVKKLALSSTSLPNELSIPFTQSDLYLYATDVNFLAASTGSMIARWDSMSRDQFRSVVKAKSKDSVHA